jgi:hypothetical protein
MSLSPFRFFTGPFGGGERVLFGEKSALFSSPKSHFSVFSFFLVHAPG